MKFLFWFSIFMIFYAYFGYALILMAIDTYRRLFGLQTSKHEGPKSPLSDESLPSASFIITAYNEEARIVNKIENTLLLSYPAEKLEIIVASDCSNDRTDDIVREYAENGIKLVRAPERKGKENAQMHAVQSATGDILIFSDVATILEPNAANQIISNFVNPSIGCVSSEDRFIDRGGHASGEGLYIRYEMLIRALESRVNTVVGLSGSFFAARKEVCRDWVPDLQSDFNTLLNTVKMGMRGISDPLSIGYYKNIIDERKEFKRKVRTVLRGITVMIRNLYLLNPSNYGLFSWQLLSHKICRWLVPLFLITAFFSNLILIGSGLDYLSLFLFQSFFYGSAIFHSMQLKKKSLETFGGSRQRAGVKFAQIARISYYFVSVNASILAAWIKYLFGKRATLWEPSKR